MEVKDVGEIIDKVWIQTQDAICSALSRCKSCQNIWSFMKDAWEIKPTTCKELKAELFMSSDRMRRAKIRTVFSSLLRKAASIVRSRGYPTNY